jgi:hypothetical protein
MSTTLVESCISVVSYSWVPVWRWLAVTWSGAVSTEATRHDDGCAEAAVALAVDSDVGSQDGERSLPDLSTTGARCAGPVRRAGIGRSDDGAPDP